MMSRKRDTLGPKSSSTATARERRDFSLYRARSDPEFDPASLKSHLPEK
jgi:hypothetical protein